MKKFIITLMLSLLSTAVWGNTADWIDSSALAAFRPEPVQGVTAAIDAKTYLVDVISSNEHQSSNPLMTITLIPPLLFINGDSLAQQQWAQEQLQTMPNSLVILIQGLPFKLSQEWQVPVYFDQAGELTARLAIGHVPARVIQMGQQLQVTEEVAL